MLTKTLQYAANDLRSVRPTKADQRRNPAIDVDAVWRSDVEHTIACKALNQDDAAEFRAACGVADE